MSSNNQIKNPTPATAEQVLASTIGSISNEQLEMNQWLGRVEAMMAMSNSMEAFSLTQLAEIKDKKLYKHFNNQTVIRDGMEVRLNTWAGFCRAINTSDKTIDEKLLNLRLLGEEALQKTESLGFTTTELRKLRKLDDNSQQVIIGEIEANIGDKDAIVELIEDMSLKHAKEKDKLKKKNKALEQEGKAKDAVIKQKQNTIDNKNDELIKMDEKLALKLNAPAFDRAKEYAAKMDVMKIDALQLFGKINALFEHIEQDAELPELLRVNQGHLLLEIKAQANTLVDQYYLGDVSVDDDDLSWIDEANAAIAERDAQNEPVLVDPVEKQAQQADDAEVFQKWKQDQGFVSDDE